MILEKAGVDLANELSKKDPVRPDLPLGWRVSPCWREVFYLKSDSTVGSVLCVAHLNDIPINEDELLSFGHGNISVFYSVWSHVKGCGRQIVFDVWDLLKKQHSKNQRYVTMSPKTEMAMKFHLDNGAKLLQENEETNNFEYE